MKTFNTILLVLLWSSSLWGANITVEKAWIRSTAPQVNISAAYMDISNKTSKADELIRIECPLAEVVEIHESKMDNGIMAMNQIPSLNLLPKQTTSLAPHGTHIMLKRLTRALKPGSEVPLTLYFKSSPKVTLKVPIKD